MKRLTDKDIRSLYSEFKTPPHVAAHCKGVTDCALKIARALMEADKSLSLDLDLIYGAGMAHDAARLKEPHEEVAADRLKELGFFEEADIVLGHMRTTDYHSINEVTEADLLYISDRIVLEDTFVGIEKRFDYIRKKMIKYGRDPDSERARRNRSNAESFVRSIEEKTGRSIFDICG